MESESVLIVATLFIFINAGFIACSELFRDSTADNSQRDIISRIICPSCVAISIIAMIGAQRRSSFLLLPFLITLILFLVFMCGLVGYLIAWCPFDKNGKDNFVCSISVVLGSVCFAGSLLVSCLYYVVYSLYKFIRSGGIDEDDLNNVTDIELLDRHNKDVLDHHDQYYDHDQPSTSYN